MKKFTKILALMLSTIFIFSSIPAFTYAEINNDILENSLSSNKVITSTESGSKDEITESNEESNLSLMKSSYLYEINYEQTKINYKKVSVEIPNLKRILDLNKADSVVIKGSMNYNGNTVQNFSKKVSLSNIKDNSFTIDFPTYGKFSVQAIFYKDNKIVNTNSSSIVGVVADEYNLAALNATFPVVQFTLSLWDMKENTNNEPIPTFVALTRSEAYNWSNLPKNVYEVPFLTDRSVSFQNKINMM